MKSSLWRARWLPGLIVILACFLAAGSGPLVRVDEAVYDLAASFTSGGKADDSVVVLAIDAPSLRQLGPWPWPRDRFAQIVDRLAEARAAVIGFALPLDQAENQHGLAYLHHLQEELEADEAVRAALERAGLGLDTDGALGRGARRAGNVVFGMPYRPGNSHRSAELPPLDATVAPFVLREVPAGRPLWFDSVPGILTVPIVIADRLYPPVPAIAQGAAAIGHLDDLSPGGGTQRAVPLVLQYGERYFPSFALRVAAYGLDQERAPLKVVAGEGVGLGNTLFPTDPALRAYPRYYRMRAGQSPFRIYSFAEVYSRQVEEGALRGKTVLIGLTAPALVDPVTTPIGEAMPPVVATAHVVSSLLNDELVRVPVWGVQVQLAALLVVGLYLMVVLPRFRFGTGLALSTVLLFLLLNAQFLLMATQSLWLPLMVPAVALLGGTLLLSLRRLAEDRTQLLHAQLDQSNRSLGQMLQSQGQLDLAFEKFRGCTMNESLLDTLYNLGLDFERKRQFGRAVGVFTHLLRHAPKFRDTNDRIRLNHEMEKMTALGKGFATSTGEATLAASYGKLQKPMLGRYQVERELGRGAMGMVYLGRDPRIGRTVAIKTMALAQEFEGVELDEVRARFFREAETAGRLNHPNIVTVYDVGEEQDLAYMAMDYLHGKPLSAYCRFDDLLPAAKVFDIMIKVAEALDYAHQQHVVHRDVKPANIMYDDKTGVAKVTDFGVACLMDASKTKTGTVLGSPSYMSPEQLAGKKVDGRSDLFSLGVTFFQLLTGELPFVADSLASLMYKIANEKHVDVRVLRPDLPACVSTIVNRTLYKDIEKRVQSGRHLANALRRCKQQITKAH